ncbi:MAG: hypothetical protein AB7I35_12110 [Ramlibacter sp.]
MMQITAAAVLCELQHHIGQDKGIHVRELVQRITGQIAATEHLERKVREAVTELRMQGEHVCGHPATGYFMASDAAELQATCNFLYSRSMTGLQQVAAMKRVSLPDLRGQLHLPT